ncbi:MAG: flagellin [Hyphomicrobiaceae bacterium]
MNSINTNFAALTALQSLNQTNQDMLTTQARISTGLKVGSASDGAAYWSMATTMRSDNAALSSVTDALGLGAATVDVAYTAMESSIDVMGEIKNKLVAAAEPGVDRAQVQIEIDALQDQLRSIATSASFTGENWMSVDNGGSDYSATESVVSSFSRNGTEVNVATIDVAVSTTFLFDANTDGSAGAAVNSGSAENHQLGILGSQRMSAAEATAVGGGALAGDIGAAEDDGTLVLASVNGLNEMDISSATDQEINDFIQAADFAISDMTSAATSLGAVSSRISLQSDFVGKLMDSIDRGISTLVDADMNEESTRLQALQVQQQLGIQAMSIANSSSQNILALFR